MSEVVNNEPAHLGLPHHDPFEGRRGGKFFSEEELEQFDRYWHLKYDITKQDLQDCTKVKPHLRLWQIKYIVEGANKFIGSATIFANTPRQAEVIFLNESNFNGFKDLLRVTEIQEILMPPVPAMLAENYTGVIDKSFLEKYPFEQKKRANIEYEELWKAINILKDYINQLDEKKTGDKIERKQYKIEDLRPKGC